MIDIDKYEEQLEDDNTDTWVVWRIAKESIEEVKRLREKNEKFGYQLIEAIGLLKMSVRRTKEGQRHYAERFERQTNAMLGRKMIE